MSTLTISIDICCLFCKVYVIIMEKSCQWINIRYGIEWNRMENFSPIFSCNLKNKIFYWKNIQQVCKREEETKFFHFILPIFCKKNYLFYEFFAIFIIWFELSWRFFYFQMNLVVFRWKSALIWHGNEMLIDNFAIWWVFQVYI